MVWFNKVIDKLKFIFNVNRVNSPTNKNNIKNTVNGNPQIIQPAAGSQVNICQGMSRDDVHALMNEQRVKIIADFRGEAIDIFSERSQETERRIVDKLFAELPREHLAKLKDPSAQLSLSTAIKNSGLLKTKDLQELLANLVIKKISSAGKEQEIEESIYQKAITVLPELTTSQLKILTLWLLTQQWRLVNIKEFVHFTIAYLEKGIKPFLDFNRSDAEFWHLTSIGCANIVTIITSNLDQLLKNKYPEVFQKEENVESLLSSNETGKRLVEIWKNSLIRSMTPTPVGLVIATTYFDQVNGNKKR